jgi:hypothetical protein
MKRYWAWRHEVDSHPERLPQNQPDMSPADKRAVARWGAAEREPSTSPVKVTASRLALDYASGLLGPAPYFNRWVEVSGGIVNGIVPLGNAAEPRCAIDVLLDESIHACVVQSQAEQSQRLEIGQTVTVVCIARFSDGGDVHLLNCHLPKKTSPPSRAKP